MSWLPLLVGVVAAAGVWLLAAGVVASRAGDATMLARQRLARQDIGLGQSAVALELEKPFVERLLAPCLLYTSPSPRDLSTSRMPSSA